MDRTIDRHISAVNVAIYPVEDGKFGKYAVAKDLLNLLVEKKKSIKVLVRNADSVQIPTTTLFCFFIKNCRRFV